MAEDIRLARSRSLRVLYGGVGFVFLALGVAGYFVPGLPGTVNLLIALWFFSMSSERMHRWMLTNKYFGQSLRDYKAGLGIPRKVKVIAVTSIVVAVSFSTIVAIHNTYARIALIGLGVVGIWFVVSRPSREVVLAQRAAAGVATT